MADRLKYRKAKSIFCATRQNLSDTMIIAQKINAVKQFVNILERNITCQIKETVSQHIAFTMLSALK